MRGPIGDAGFDGIGERGVDEEPGARLAYGGEAGEQRGAGVGGGAQRGLRLSEQQGAAAPRLALRDAHREVRVEVHEAGQQRRVAELERRRPRRQRRRGRRTGVGDLVAFDDDERVLDELAGAHVEEARGVRAPAAAAPRAAG